MFRGSIPALVTPFRDGSVDDGALEALVEWHVEEGSHGLVPVGTTGESPTLTHEEHEHVIEIVVRAAAGRLPVIAGAGSNSTAEAIRLMRFAKRVEADAALVVTPYYNKPTQRGLLAHFRALSECCDLPIIIYNIPGRSVVDMTPETMGELARLPTVVGVKDATGDVVRVSHQRATCGHEFIQLSGEGRFRARVQCPRRMRLHLGDRERGAAALRGVPGGDARRELDAGDRTPGSAPAAAHGSLHRTGHGRCEVRPLRAREVRRGRAFAPDRRTPGDEGPGSVGNAARGAHQLNRWRRGSSAGREPA